MHIAGGMRVHGYAICVRSKFSSVFGSMEDSAAGWRGGGGGGGDGDGGLGPQQHVLCQPWCSGECFTWVVITCLRCLCLW